MWRILLTVVVVAGLSAAGYAYRAELGAAIDSLRAEAPPENAATIDTMAKLQEATAEKFDDQVVAPTPAPAAAAAPVAPGAKAAPVDPQAAGRTRSLQNDIVKCQAVIDRNTAILTKIQTDRIVEQYERAARKAPTNSDGDVARVRYQNLLADIATAQKRIAYEQGVIAARKKTIDEISPSR